MKNPFGKKTKNTKESDLSDFMQAEMAHARLGVLYIFSKTYPNKLLDGMKIGMSGTTSLVGGTLGGTGKLLESDGLKNSGTGVKGGGTLVLEIVKQTLPKGAPKSSKDGSKASSEAWYVKLWNWLKNFFGSIPGMVAAKYQSLKVDPTSWGSYLKSAISGIISAIMDAAVPLSGVFDVASGVTKAARAGFNRAATWWDMRVVPLMEGHTKTIIDAVNKSMMMSLGEGLWTAVKGGMQIGLDVTAAGAGTLAKAIATGIEMVVKLVIRICEWMMFDKFREHSEKFWNARNSYPVHTNGKAFNEWFRIAALDVPAIGAIALNCGYCGGPMQYLSMYTASGKPISQKDFDRGTAMLARLKRFSADYLDASGAATFSSSDPVVKAALKAAVNYGNTPEIYGTKRSIKQNKVGDVLYGLVTG